MGYEEIITVIFIIVAVITIMIYRVIQDKKETAYWMHEHQGVTWGSSTPKEFIRDIRVDYIQRPAQVYDLYGRVVSKERVSLENVGGRGYSDNVFIICIENSFGYWKINTVCDYRDIKVDEVINLSRVTDVWIEDGYYIGNCTGGVEL